MACMIFETIVEIVTSIGDEGCPFFNQCVGVGLVVLKLGLVGCYCGCMTRLLHGQKIVAIYSNAIAKYVICRKKT